MKSELEFIFEKLSGLDPISVSTKLPGWSSSNSRNPFFVEAPIGLRKGFESTAAKVWLISAPGAVGKSTLAREIAARTNAVYLDLAKAETIGGNSLTGGLVKNKIFSQWESQKTTVLIDALDEARLRVTQKAFEDFLADIASLSLEREIPTIIFGRTAIIDDAWATLSMLENPINCPIFDIGFFEAEQAREFILKSLETKSKDDQGLERRLKTARGPYADAAKNFVNRLRESTTEGDVNFSGYAPVLEAIAAAIGSETNPAKLIAEIPEDRKEKVLQQIIEEILLRESKKFVATLDGDFSEELKALLYGPKEQLERLAAHLYNCDGVTFDTKVPTVLIAAYEEKVRQFLFQHPFLSGNGRRPAGPVFAAKIDVEGLLCQNESISSAVERNIGSGPHTPNPFLFSFYTSSTGGGKDSTIEARTEHIAFLFESVQASLSSTERGELSIDADLDSAFADVEILRHSPPNKAQKVVATLKIPNSGKIKFTRVIDGVFLESPKIDVQIGSGTSVEIISPVAINAESISFDSPELIVTSRSDRQDGITTLEATTLKNSTLVGPPVLRNGANLLVTWPNSRSYPWTSFSSAPVSEDGEKLEVALRSLRRLVMAFRSHSRGRLARYTEKIEHGRMTKGKIGEAIRAKMLADEILSKDLSQNMYFLDPTKMGEKIGINFSDIKLKKYNENVRRYLAPVLN